MKSTMKKPAIKEVVDDRDFDEEMLSDDEGLEDPRPGKKSSSFEPAPAAEDKSPEEEQISDGKNESWRVAARIVREFHPVPRMVWVIIRNVYGRVGTSTHKIDPMIFSDVEPLIVKAAHDKTLGAQPPAPTPPGAPQKSVIMSRQAISAKPDPAPAAAAAPEIEIRNLEHAVSIIGSDVAGSICFIHAICRRVANSVAEKVWRPILDDALLRAHMGYLVGKNSRVFGPGRGMMAGFCGRSGLAILIGSGTMEQAHSALSWLAAGVEIGEICIKVYGCNPLQVAAMAAVSAGFNRDIATIVNIITKYPLLDTTAF